MTQLVLRTDSDGIAALSLNRPEKLNALSVAVFQELEEHVLDVAGRVDDIGCVIVKGAGRCFSAGHDLSDIAAGERPPRANYQAHVIEELANLPQPVIAAVHSHCYTGALELALAGDLILASENALFADTHAKWALTPVWGLSQRLPRRVGKTKAAEMMLTTRTYTAQEALEMGLANFKLPDEDFEEAVLAFAREMLENSWFSLRANKRLLHDTDGLELDQGLAHEIYHAEGSGPDAGERIGRFGKKGKS